MHSHSIKDLLDLPELFVHSTKKMDGQIFIDAEPVASHQPCPVCASVQTIRRGINSIRKVRHLDSFGCVVYLNLPAIRLSCTSCGAHFVWSYNCVAPKKRYTKAFENSLPKQVVGATVIHAARVTNTPATTIARVVHTWKTHEAARIQETCQSQALTHDKLVLGIDDFAIRKGHTYNTGLHDLRNGTFLDIIPGRTIEELQDYFNTQPTLLLLNPVAIVMDLAKAYHTFAKTMYPSAIRIADRYHVNRYVAEALQTVRKSVQKELPSRAKKELKKHFRILGKRNDQLTRKEQTILHRLLSYNPLLQQIYDWKEAFIEWYDCSATYDLAKKGFVRWLNAGNSIDHPAVQACLSTMRNWQEEICNYHQLRFTNAAVEGKNNLIKSLQRRHFFTRNPQHYKDTILIECNAEWIQYDS
jgi:transposase